jgi:hypothetical protein
MSDGFGDFSEVGKQFYKNAVKSAQYPYVNPRSQPAGSSSRQPKILGPHGITQHFAATIFRRGKVVASGLGISTQFDLYFLSTTYLSSTNFGPRFSSYFFSVLDDPRCNAQNARIFAPRQYLQTSFISAREWTR